MIFPALGDKNPPTFGGFYFHHTVSMLYSTTNGMDNVVMFSTMDLMARAISSACDASHSNTISS